MGKGKLTPRVKFRGVVDNGLWFGGFYIKNTFIFTAHSTDGKVSGRLGCKGWLFMHMLQSKQGDNLTYDTSSIESKIFL